MAGIHSEFDVVVCGSGAAGLTAAVVCAQSGLTVLLLEKTDLIGGTTAYSVGVPWIPNNHHMAALGEEDSIEQAESYLRSVLGNWYHAAKVRAFLTSSPEMVMHMEATTSVEFFPVGLPDYYPELPGARVGRSLFVRQFDGARLGAKWLRRVRPPLRGFVAFKDMQVDPSDLPKLQNAFKTWGGFHYAIRRLIGYGIDKLLYGKGALMANGNALIGRLLHSAIGLGVEIWTESRPTEILREGQNVRAVRIERDGTFSEIRIRRALVFATGGFGGNIDWTKKYLPMPEDHISVQPAANKGDGIALAQRIGAALGRDNIDNGVWAPVSVIRGKSGEIVDKYPHFGPDRAKPGSLIVDAQGDRFANEAAPYQVFVNAMHSKNVRKAWFIADKAFLRRYGMGFALPAPMPFRHLVREGYLIEAHSFADLADQISVDRVALANTLSRFNEAAAIGRDTDFGRGSNIYDQSQGDPGHNPPNLRPLLQGPFYAVALYPGDVSTVLGLETDENGQVLDDRQAPMAGLYAVGLDQNSVMRGFYPGGGSGIGPAMTFAYRAARHIARLPKA